MKEYLMVMFSVLYLIAFILFAYFSVMVAVVQSEYWIGLCGMSATIQIVLLIIIRYLQYSK